ncbi:MAG: GNAT family N-acetyltransferase [Candidatus Gottesmanbacteria bacterium]
MEEKRKDFQIVEFQPKYQTMVIDLISKVLRDQKVIPDSTEPIDDEDLHYIPRIYFGKGRFWVAVHKENVIGTVAIRDTGGNTAKLNRMFVETQFHGTGIGQTLLDYALGFAREQGFREIILNTHLLMKRAHRFYEKNGFQKVKKVSDTYHYQRSL